MFSLSRRATAEFIGTLLLVCTVVGSGIMAETLTKDMALALLANSLATGCVLVVLVSLLGNISGAHFNPAVSLIFATRRELPLLEAGLYVVAQVTGGIAGTATAHMMFSLPLFTFSARARTGDAQWFSEGIAAFGLVFVILIGLRTARDSLAWLVGLYIAAAYWFTASTSFANPAVAVARSLTNTFSGIRPLDVPAFIVAEIVGALAALALASWLLRGRADR